MFHCPFQKFSQIKLKPEKLKLLFHEFQKSFFIVDLWIMDIASKKKSNTIKHDDFKG